MSNNIVYIVQVEDPTTKSKYRTFATTKVDKGQYVEFRGYELTSLKTTVKNYEDLLQIVISNALEMQELVIPWQRVISIRNISYRVKQ